MSSRGYGRLINRLGHDLVDFMRNLSALCTHLDIGLDLFMPHRIQVEQVHCRSVE